MEPKHLKEKAIAFLTAHFAGDAKTAVALCSPSFETTISAPVEIFPHLGHKKGALWIEESIRLERQRYVDRRFEVMSALGDGDESVLLVRSKLRKRRDHRMIDFISVHMFSFVDGLITRHRELFDSFDMVEQLLGVDLTAEFAERLGKAV